METQFGTFSKPLERNYKTYKLDLCGRQLSVDIGRVGAQANGAVLMHYGDTTVLATATASKEPREGIDFFPLSVEYEEKMYAAGKIPGGFIKREGRPSEKAILNSRLMDRPLRPLFPKGFYNDVQVVATVMSVDLDAPSEIAAMIGSSVALSISGAVPKKAATVPSSGFQRKAGFFHRLCFFDALLVQRPISVNRVTPSSRTCRSTGAGRCRRRSHGRHR